MPIMTNEQRAQLLADCELLDAKCRTLIAIAMFLIGVHVGLTLGELL